MTNDAMDDNPCPETDPNVLGYFLPIETPDGGFVLGNTTLFPPADKDGFIKSLDNAKRDYKDGVKPIAIATGFLSAISQLVPARLGKVTEILFPESEHPNIQFICSEGNLAIFCEPNSDSEGDFLIRVDIEWKDPRLKPSPRSVIFGVWPIEIPHDQRNHIIATEDVPEGSKITFEYAIEETEREYKDGDKLVPLVVDYFMRIITAILGRNGLDNFETSITQIIPFNYQSIDSILFPKCENPTIQFICPGGNLTVSYETNGELGNQIRFATEWD